MGMKKDDDDLSFLEEGEKSPVGMIIGGVVLLIVIIVLCVVIWKLSHKGGDGQASPGADSWTQSTVQETQESSQPEPSTMEASEPSGESSASSQASSEASKPDGEGGAAAMTFHEVNETVTAKEATNLRSEPSTEKDETIVVKIKNGETVTRTGLNDYTGWSRLEYKGQTVYALSRLLTTDLTAPSSEPQPSKTQASDPVPAPSKPASSASSTDGDTVTTKDGTTVTFTPCDDVVSPKMEVNLRGEPSTSQGNDSVHYRLKYGETVRRTGYQSTGDDTGWSRVEYNGETLYAVTSYLFVVEETDGEAQ